jgi:O-antigen/teichoic acid export membrane protein
MSYSNSKLRFSQFRVNMASGLASSILGVGLTAVTYPLYIHYLGYEKYGLWLLLSTIVTFSQLGNLGISQAVSKQVAEAHGVADITGVRECVTNALGLLLVSGLIVLSVLLLGKARIISGLGLMPDNARIAASVIPYIGLLSVYVFIVDATNATLAGLGRIDLCNYSQFTAQLISAGLGIALVQSGAGIPGLLAGSAVSYVCLHAVSLYATRRLLKGSLFVFGCLSIKRAKHLLGFGLSLTAGGILAMLLNPLNKIILARYAGLSAIPIYDLSFNGCMRIRNLFDSSQKAIIPEVSRLLARSRAQAYLHARALNRQSYKIILYAAPLYVGLVAAATPLLRLWLGSKFDPASAFTVRVMLVGAFASLMGMPTYYSLIGLGYAKSIFAANLTQLVVNLSIIAFGVIVYSKASAALVVSSTAVGMACSAIWLAWSFTRVTSPISTSGSAPAIATVM